MLEKEMTACELVDRAEELRREGRLEESLETVDRCLEHHPEHPRALLTRGRVLYQGGMVSRALSTLGSLEAMIGWDEGLARITECLRGLLQEPEPAMDSAFLTETMAELHIKQSYLWDAMEIYRQLYAAQPEERLWRKILELRRSLEKERFKTREEKSRRLAALDQWIAGQRKDD